LVNAHSSLVQYLLICYLKNINIKTYKAIILLAVLYGCGTWALTQREEHRLRMSENRSLREYFDYRQMT
jgi:hypothetical protein